MRWTRLLAVVAFLVLPFLAGCSHETAAEHAADQYATQELNSRPRLQNLPEYSLSPDDLVKAQHLDALRNSLEFGDEVWGIVRLALLLWLGIAAWMRDRAVAAGSGLRQRQHPWLARWVEGAVFASFFVVITALLELPVEIFGHHTSLAYGFSVQQWPSWFAEKLKTLLVNDVISILLLMLLFWVIRKFPRRYWVVFWAFLAPISVFMIFVQPLVIDPLFNKFEPLGKTQPELVKRLSQVVARGNMNIPPERMFLMKASEKTTTINAYVTGFGASERLVIWDTSLAKLTPDQVVMVFGHESGHYVLHHIVRGSAMSFLGLFVGFFLIFHAVRWLLRRFGAAWRIPSQEDWGVIVALALVATFLGAVGSFIVNTSSRHIEHEADVYGQEAIHGLVADPQATTVSTMDALGKSYLEVPNPYPFFVIWQYNHPSISYRAAFGKAYDPWAPGMEPKYFKADSKQK